MAVNSIKHRRNLESVRGHLAVASRQAPSLAWVRLHRYMNGSEEHAPGSGKQVAKVARSFELIYQPEQAPNRANRVTLSERRDALGYRLAHLSWRWSQIDLLSIWRVRQILASELRACGVADLVQEEDDIFPRGEGALRPPGAVHHLLGTTRMHDLPRHGVVDRDGRVHGSSSVYVAGASVFPTGGYANPSLTVVALAIRLADELRHIMSAA